ncbi:MAG: precorrin-6y C5,15-methyltransferase (decarboxylating) subunit CbiE [Christensenellales bacterium]|jgi:precorrin-6Y C5,15-methyltransferase (decarboxylating)
MKHVTIVGIGMGADTVTIEGRRAIDQAQAVFGAPRMLAAFPRHDRPSYPVYEPDKVSNIVRESELSQFAVLVSGDAGFYSAADALIGALSLHDVQIIPGISSVSYFFAKIQRPWQHAELISCHARAANFVDRVRRNRLTFALTGGNVPSLARALADAGYAHLDATVGENLGAPNERIYTLPTGALAEASVEKLAVLLVENPESDARIRFGIPDGEFIRGDVPMTKSEVRAQIMSRLALAPDVVCADIGAGTGSVSVEMALAAHRGHVYAIDREENAVSLIYENARKFHIGNISPLHASVPGALDELPPLDAAFIGGSGGAMADIFTKILSKNPHARLVLTAIALQTLHAATAAFQAHGIAPEIVQIGAARAKPAGNLHMLIAQNPVFVLAGGGV